MTSDTVYEAASLSKPVFAYAALKMVEKGMLGLDDPLDRFLPQPFMPNEPRFKLITARMVLLHTPEPNPRRFPFEGVRPISTASRNDEGFRLRTAARFQNAKAETSIIGLQTIKFTRDFGRA